MRLRSLICGEINLLDAASNKVSCINLLDDLTVPQFPIALTQVNILAIFTQDQGDAEEQAAEIALFLEGEELVRGPIMISFQGASTARSFLNLLGLVLPIPGVLRITVIHEGSEIGAWEVSIRQGAPEIVQQL